VKYQRLVPKYEHCLFSGNDEHIAKICDQVTDLLVEHDLILQPPDTMDPFAMNQLRGLLVYLVLNTAHDYFLCKSQWSANVMHLCNQLPPIPLFLTIAIGQIIYIIGQTFRRRPFGGRGRGHIRYGSKSGG